MSLYLVRPYVLSRSMDVVELAVGTPVALWLGEEGESDQERAARLDAARDILSDQPELATRVSRIATQTTERAARELVAA